MDVGLSGECVSGCQPGVVDVGGGGCVQEDQERRQDGTQGLRQEDAHALGAVGGQGEARIKLIMYEMKACIRPFQIRNLFLMTTF